MGWIRPTPQALKIVAAAGAALAIGAVTLAGYARVQAQGESRCTLAPNKVASPGVVNLGQTVRVTLTLEASCPLEASAVDAFLVIDESASMADGNKMANARAAALAFLGAMDLEHSRVGLVSFTNGTAALRVPLTHDATRIQQAVGSLVPGGRTNVSAAITIAHEQLILDKSDAVPAMVVLTDGRQTVTTEPIDVAAGRAKADGITIATFCAGTDCDPELRLAASAPELHFDVPDPSQLPGLYAELAGSLQTNGVDELVIRDQVPANMRYVDGSAVPAPDAIEPNQVLVWRFDGLPPPPGIFYDLEPLAPGTHPTNVTATGEFTDRQGKTGATEFPIPRVQVIGPDCLPRALEIYFLIDDSNCLQGQLLNGRPALEAIRDGVIAVLDQIELGRDTAAVIGFGDRAITFQTLTTDYASIVTAVNSVRMLDGTARLDLAYRAVAQEMATSRHNPDAQVVTITVTDGPMMQSPEVAELQGLALRARGVKHYAIGVGFVSQHAVLRSVSEPGGYYEIPFGGDVITPYAAIGEKVAYLSTQCGPEAETPTPPPEPRPEHALHLPSLWRGPR